MITAGHNNSNRPDTQWARLQRQSRKIIFAALILSGLFHLLSYVRLSNYRYNPKVTIQQSQQPVKIRIVQKPKTDDKPDVKAQKILETPQQETQKPEVASHLGNVNHTTAKETKVEARPREKALDPGQKGNPLAKQVPAAPKPAKADPVQAKTTITSKTGTVSISDKKQDKQPRNAYESLLPSSINDLYGQVNAGYQDYIDDDLDIGDRIDINTSEYRFIGYFTNMRKAIELVWNYPIEASQRGMQGEVGLEFAINKDGTTSRIKVLKSSGYDILDRAIVEAIRLASPFSPLPTGFGKNKIVVTGSFRYVLSAYGSH